MPHPVLWGGCRFQIQISDKYKWARASEIICVEENKVCAWGDLFAMENRLVRQSDGKTKIIPLPNCIHSLSSCMKMQEQAGNSIA